MQKSLKYLLRALLGFLALLIIYLAFVLVIGTLNDWQPEAAAPLEPLQTAEETVIQDSILSFVIWNLGYGGLGEESDFFFDHGNMFFSGGRMVRPSRELVEKNIAGNTVFVQTTRADFFLFQEADYRSKRSYFINQVEEIREELPEYAAYYAPNYQAGRVPIPLLEPWKAYGAVNSGLATFSRFQPVESTRYQLPGTFAWPTRIFQLDRCIALHRYKVERGPELVVMNIHNSAYDEDGGLKRQQMAFIKELVLAEYGKGNYVVVGGDWNMCPPFFRFDGFMPGDTKGYTQLNIEPDFLPEDWQWIYDPRVPTNRKIRTPYVAGESFITLIDFYLISPNLRARLAKTLDQQFRFSDHQPVYLEVELR